MKKSYTLWLPTWYPSKLSSYNGDFIQRHANAVANYEHIEVVYVVNDEKGIITKHYFEEEFNNGNLHEKIIYYHNRTTKVKLLDTFLSFRSYCKIYKKAIKNLIVSSGKPKLVHIHVSGKIGYVAQWIKNKIGIDYIVTEHWSAFMREGKPNFIGLPFYIRKLVTNVFRNARLVTVVSKSLGERLQELFSIPEFIITPNVINGKTFYLDTSSARNPKKFIHISTLTYQKNPEHLLEAFSVLKKRNIEVFLDIIGPANNNLASLIKKNGLDSNISLYSEMPQVELANLIRKCNALILYSRFETFGCVIVEANACGIPVIVSDIEVFHENVKEGFNGIFAVNLNASALADKIEWCINNPDHFKSDVISKNALEKYSFENIGLQFVGLYKKILEQS
jgi:glycosyltransferase involved in cell wall biosynthesis